jgi:hypothetical protein
MPLYLKTAITGSKKVLNLENIAQLSLPVVNFCVLHTEDSFTAKVGTEGADENFLFWNVFKELYISQSIVFKLPLQNM